MPSSVGNEVEVYDYMSTPVQFTQRGCKDCFQYLEAKDLGWWVRVLRISVQASLWTLSELEISSTYIQIGLF